MQPDYPRADARQWSPVSCVTYPRSGHHLLVRLIANYQLNLNQKTFCVHKNLEDPHGYISAGQMQYCTYYRHCNSVPCTDNACNLQKNHDFDLTLELPATNKLLVQVRHPLESIISFYYWRLKRANEHSKNKTDSRAAWQRFLKIRPLPLKRRSPAL